MNGNGTLESIIRLNNHIIKLEAEALTIDGDTRPLVETLGDAVKLTASSPKCVCTTFKLSMTGCDCGATMKE